MTDNKTCSKCKRELSTNQYWKDSSTTSGFRPVCKDCSRKSKEKECVICHEKYIGSSRQKNCKTCIDSKPIKELHPRKLNKPCSDCGKEVDRSDGKKYRLCSECATIHTDKSAEKLREYMRGKRRDPKYREQEKAYQEKYCEKRGITEEELLVEIYQNNREKLEDWNAVLSV
eukprot:Lithocolla_globosa_v1_NODE_94_length_6505_cov_642.519311.p4 type:complete len:172 gc:universal NODE_94_length_6505_cov_642.519311:5716-6231(+)